MARPRKENTEEKVKVEQIEATTESVEQEETGEAGNSGQKPVFNDEIPEVVDDVLKAHPELPKAWVNSKGWLFTENTPEYMTSGGVLYDNKYFNN